MAHLDSSSRRFRYVQAIAILLAMPLLAATAEEQAVLAPVRALFDGMAKRDKAAIRELLLPEGSATMMRDGKVVQFPLSAFPDRLGTGTTRIEERIHDPLIKIDEDIAIVWAPYEFLVDGKVHHCGTDAFNLVRRGGRWLIAGIADNSRQNCPAR